MINNVKLLDTMSAMARHAAQRHAIIADNVANADTPGYVAKDIQAFSDVYAKAAREGTNVRMVQADTMSLPVHDIASPNGNTVSLEQQMMLSAQNKGQHELATAVYKKTLEMFKIAVGKNL